LIARKNGGNEITPFLKVEIKGALYFEGNLNTKTYAFWRCVVQSDLYD